MLVSKRRTVHAIQYNKRKNLLVYRKYKMKIRIPKL